MDAGVNEHHADQVAEYFAALGRRAHEPSLAQFRGRVRFDLAGDARVDTWGVTIADGDISVSRDPVGADCTVHTNRFVFEGLASGEMNAMSAMLRGALDADGDLELLVAFQRVLPLPTDRSDGR